jgi:hypothetical protein
MAGCRCGRRAGMMLRNIVLKEKLQQAHYKVQTHCTSKIGHTTHRHTMHLQRP